MLCLYNKDTDVQVIVNYDNLMIGYLTHTPKLMIWVDSYDDILSMNHRVKALLANNYIMVNV